LSFRRKEKSYFFDAAGIKKPDCHFDERRNLISILSEEIQGMEHKNLAIEVLKKLLKDEIKARAKKNLIQSQSLMEMLENAINKYQNKIITAAEVIDELIKLSQEIQQLDKQPAEMGLSEFEYAFYTAVASNNNAKELMSKEKLRELAVAITNQIKQCLFFSFTLKKDNHLGEKYFSSGINDLPIYFSDFFLS
jgi:type I restriction enzyme R subunit